MATQAQISANRANSLLSTGPVTPEGKANSAANSRRHGLLSSSGIYFSPEEQEDYNDLEDKLRNECQPATELERQTFLRYAFNTYQLMRSQRFEVEAQEAALLSPESDIAFHRMERMAKLTALLERRADKALNELRKLQQDRMTAREIETELNLLEQHIPVPASLPVAAMRRSSHNRTSVRELALLVWNATPEVRSVLENQTKPIGESTASAASDRQTDMCSAPHSLRS